MTPNVFILLLVAMLMLLMGAVLWHAAGAEKLTYRGPPAYVIRPYGHHYGLFKIMHGDKKEGEIRHPFHTGTKLSCKLELQVCIKQDRKDKVREATEPVYYNADGRKTT